MNAIFPTLYRIVSKTEAVDDTFNLRVGPYVDTSSKIVVGKRRPSFIQVAAAEIDFRARLKKVYVENLSVKFINDDFYDFN